MNCVQKLTLTKAGHRYVFHYKAGQETGVIASIAALAESEEQDFDYLDAAVLSCHMGRLKTKGARVHDSL